MSDRPPNSNGRRQEPAVEVDDDLEALERIEDQRLASYYASIGGPERE